jgi:hypothetical protein
MGVKCIEKSLKLVLLVLPSFSASFVLIPSMSCSKGLLLFLLPTPPLSVFLFGAPSFRQLGIQSTDKNKISREENGRYLGEKMKFS